MKHRLLSTLVAIFFISFFATNCNTKPQNTNEKKIKNWYNYLLSMSFQSIDSIEYYNQLIGAAATNGNIETQAIAAIANGIVSGKKAFFQLAKKQFAAAYSLLKNTDLYLLQAKALIGLAAAESKLGNADAFFEHALNALKMYEQNKNVEGVAGVYAQMAEHYQLAGDVANAIVSIEKGLQFSENNKSGNPYLLNLHTLANIYGMQGNLDSALLIDKQGLALSIEAKKIMIQSMFYDNRALCYLMREQFDSAKKYFSICLQLDSSQGNYKQVADTYSNMAAMFLQQKQYDTTYQYITTAIALGNKTEHILTVKNGWEILAETYRLQKKYDKALAAKDSAASAKNKLINEKSELKVVELKELYESDKKAQTIQLQQAQLKNQKTITIGIVAIIIALFITAITFYKNEKIKKEKQLQQKLSEQQMQATINIIEAEEKERQRIASDLHDGVGQMMMAAWLNLQALEQQSLSADIEQKQLLEKSIRLVNESCKEVRSVSHRMMPNALTKKGLVNAVRDFIQQIDRNIIRITLQTEGLQTTIPFHIETILYRVIQESVNNVIKHAAATTLDIAIHQNKQSLDLLIEDNGRGFNLQQALQKDGIGLQNIKSKIAYLNGTVHWDSGKGNGTVVAIFIPIA